MITYIAELSRKTNYSPINTTPSNDIQRSFNVYELFMGQHPVDTYWLNWGGQYDNLISKNIELYFDQFLVRVNTIEEVEQIAFTYIILNDFVFFNLPKHPWQYPQSSVAIRERTGFLSAPINENNPSDIFLNGSPYPVRLEVPLVNTKLSDVISGLTKYSSFDFSLINDDGFFDLSVNTNFFNSPVLIKKSVADHPSYTDFKTIRSGFVENIKVNNKTMTISAADMYRSFDESVCSIISGHGKADGKQLPVIYGTVNADLIEIEEGKYLIAENVSRVNTVYDDEGNSVKFEYDGAILSVLPVLNEDGEEEIPNSKYAHVTGYDMRIGEIIVDLISRKTPVFFTETNFDVEEVNRYISDSARINILFSSGAVKSAINEVLKNDMAFLVQKNDGRLTIRLWGEEYQTHEVNNYLITQHPSKDFAEAQNNYASSIVVEYDYDYQSSEYQKNLVFGENESSAEELYSKEKRKTFQTNLIFAGDAENLAKRLSDRFSFLKDSIQIGIGVDTSEFNLLDTINMEIEVNGRIYSENTAWIIKAIDPAQDKLTLEAKG